MLLFLIRTIFVICAISNYVLSDIENNAPIVIVGAGASGLAAAARLLAHNFSNILVLEAEDRIGGRIHSLQFGDAFVDLGAEYCYGEHDNIVFYMAEQYNLLKPYKPEYELYYSGDGRRVDADVHKKIFNLSHLVASRKQCTSSESDACFNMFSEGACLKHNFEKFIDFTKDDYKSIFTLSYTWLRNHKSLTKSCLNLDDVSLVSNYKRCEGDKNFEWRGLGYRTLLDVLMHKHVAQKELPRLDINVLLETKVSSIVASINGNQVEVMLEGGTKVSADHVIFTPSLGVLKFNHKNLFFPSLPKEKIFAIENIGYGVTVKIALYFARPRWTSRGHKNWGCIWSAEHNLELDLKNLNWVRYFTEFTVASENENVLIARFAGEACQDIENLSDRDILRGIRFILSKCFVSLFGIDTPTKIIRSRWGENSNFRGTNSYDSVRGIPSSDIRHRKILENSILNGNGVPILLFAGEATHRTKFATVHGAIETGYREADRLICYYRENI